MREFKEGTLHSGSKVGPEVTSRKQAIAIALSEARRKAKSKVLKHRMMGHVKSMESLRKRKTHEVI